MQWGLRQGDHLSPFLFALVVEILNRLLSRALDLGILEGIKIGRQNVSLSRLQFADDTILFCPEDRHIFLNYIRILECFSLMSGLRINYEKIAIIPLNYAEDWVLQMKSELNCSVLSLPVKYLGIPLGAKS